MELTMRLFRIVPCKKTGALRPKTVWAQYFVEGLCYFCV